MMRRHSTINLPGSTVARILASAWRETPDAANFSEGELAAVTLQLYDTGGASLAWWRIRHSPLAATPTGQQFHDAYKHLRLAARVHEQEIKYVISLLRAEGIEPVLVKGWAIARAYPDPALRPYGDIDLCVAPDRFAQAQKLLNDLGDREGHHVDLHFGFAKLEGPQAWHGRPAREGAQDSSSTRTWYRKPEQNVHATWNGLFERSQLLDLGEVKVRVLCDEDHLRVLCLHLLRSGAWRPLWLCDVALLLESRTRGFDWNICLTENRLQADWIVCAIGLAHQLLGVDIDDTPVAERAKRLPRWLVPAVLRQWDRCRNSHAAGTALPTLLSDLTEPKKLVSELYARWDNPVRSTTALRGRFNNWPRLPYQLAELITHSPELPKQLRLMFRQRLHRSPRGRGASVRIDQVQDGLV